MRRRSDAPFARIGVAGSMAAVCLALTATPTVASDRHPSATGRSVNAAAVKQKLKIFKQVATPNAYGRPAVYVDCEKCKGTVTLFTVGKRPSKLGSARFTKALSNLVGVALVKLNSQGRKLNKKSKVTVLAKAKSGKIAVQRKIGLRKAVGPCDVVTAAQVAIIMGEPVDRGTEDKSAVLSGDGRMCMFEASAKRPLVTPRVLLTLVRGYGAGSFRFLPAIYDRPGQLTPVHGVGTKAYYVNVGSPMSELHAIKRDTYVYVSSPTPAPAGSRPELLPALLNAALARLR